MGRPIKKKFFGSNNVNDGLTYTSTGGESVSSITYTNRGTNYSQGLTATTAASPIGGTSAVITIAAVSTANGRIDTATVSTAGSGYTSPPAITLVKPANVNVTGSTFAAGNILTVSSTTGLYVGMAANAAFASTTKITAIDIANVNVTMGAANTGSTSTAISFGDIGSAGSLTAVLVASATTANTIRANAWTTTSSVGQQADIVSQRSSRRYRVTNATETAVCRLVPTGLNGVNSPTVAQVVAAGGPTAAGEMTLTAFDSDNGSYVVGKLESRTALLFPADIDGYTAGTQFTANSHVKWTSTGAAVVNTTVKLASND
jgi:hypothetical protein